MFGDPDAAGSIALSVVDDELTELIAMANDYLESGEDRQARSEIAEVLDRIQWSIEDLDAMVAADGIGAAPSAAPGGGEGPAGVRIAYSL